LRMTKNFLTVLLGFFSGIPSNFSIASYENSLCKLLLFSETVHHIWLFSINK
jgi:hypothetical protein